MSIDSSWQEFVAAPKNTPAIFTDTVERLRQITSRFLVTLSQSERRPINELLISGNESVTSHWHDGVTENISAPLYNVFRNAGDKKAPRILNALTELQQFVRTTEISGVKAHEVALDAAMKAADETPGFWGWLAQQTPKQSLGTPG